MKLKLITFTLLFAGYLLYDRLNYQFCQESIHLKNWPAIEYHEPQRPQGRHLAAAILDQKFTFLGKGRQVYAFLSQDGLYVLKLLRCNRLNGCDFLDNFPLPRYFEKKRHALLKARDCRFNSLFISLNLCSHEMSEQTGTLYAHIQPTKEFHKVVSVKDRLGMTHEIDIDSVPFIIQKKAERVIPELKRHLETGSIEALNCRLDQLIDLIVQRARMGIVDPDGRLLRNNNVGFLPDRAIYIDMGTFFRSYKSCDVQHLRSDFRQLKPIVKLLKSHDPQLAKDFQRRMDDAIRWNSKLP